MGRKWWWVAAGAVAVLVAVVVAGVLWPSPGKAKPRARVYRDHNACLLTDSRGVAGAEASGAWAGMREASLATKARVQYLAVTGPATPENAGPFLAALVQRRCEVVVGVGPAQVTAVEAAAARYPRVAFGVVGDGGPGVTGLAGGTVDEIRVTVGKFVTSAVNRPNPQKGASR
ncbi:MAG: hypothetical protein ACJ73S_11335 [Mycobacteriales bacterium]